MTEAFQEAAIEQWTWKTAAMKAMTLAVCRLALKSAECGAGSAEFSANDLEEFNHGGTGICGTVFGRLAKDGVIAPVGAFVGGEFVQKFVKNAGGNRIGVWRLKNGALARRALALHGQAEAELKQLELV
jgi:hypothetical protein